MALPNGVIQSLIDQRLRREAFEAQLAQQQQAPTQIDILNRRAALAQETEGLALSAAEDQKEQDRLFNANQLNQMTRRAQGIRSAFGVSGLGFEDAILERRRKDVISPDASQGTSVAEARTPPPEPINPILEERARMLQGERRKSSNKEDLSQQRKMDIINARQGAISGRQGQRIKSRTSLQGERITSKEKVAGQTVGEKRAARAQKATQARVDKKFEANMKIAQRLWDEKMALENQQRKDASFEGADPFDPDNTELKKKENEYRKFIKSSGLGAVR